jgi:hypothetical protein
MYKTDEEYSSKRSGIRMVFSKGNIDLRVVNADLTVISEVRCSVHEIPPLVPNLYHMNLVNNIITNSFKINFNIIHQCRSRSPKWSLSLSLLTTILINVSFCPYVLHNLHILFYLF